MMNMNWIAPNSTNNSTPTNPPLRFYIQSSPDPIDTSSNISITCYTSPKKQSIIPCRFTWYQSKNGLTNELPVKGTAYMCEPGDAGAVIKVEVQSLDEERSGKTVLQFGPVKMDVLLKKNIQNVLRDQHGEFGVFLGNQKGQERELQLKITEGYIRVKTLNGEKYLRFDYSVGSPAIQLSLKDSSRIIMNIPTRSHDQYQKFLSSLSPVSPHRKGQPHRMQLRFVNRFSRDVFLFSHKIFSAKKQLKNAHLLNSLQHPDLQMEQTFNYLLQMEGLRFDLYRLIVVNAKLQEEKEFYRREVGRLEEEMMQVREVYARLLEQGQGQQQGVQQQQQMFDRQSSQLGMNILGAMQQPMPPQLLTPQQTTQFNLQGVQAFSNLFNHLQPTTPQSPSSLNPLQKLQLDRSFAQMLTTLLPPQHPQPSPQQLLDQNLSQSLYQSLFAQNVQLRDHINKLSCQVAWFYSQHGQPTLPLRLRYRVSQETAIKQQPSQEKSRTKERIEIEQLMESFREESYNNKELEKLNESLSRLVKENEEVTGRNQQLGFRVGNLEELVKMKEDDCRLALNRIGQLTCTISSLEYFIFKLRNPGPNSISFTYNGQKQTGIPFRAHDYTFDPTTLIKQIQSIKSKNNELLQQRSELTKLKYLAQADTLVLTNQKAKLEAEVKILNERLRRGESELLAAIKKSTKVEGKLAELISENTHVHKTQNRNSEKKQNQLVMELEQEINRLTVLVTEKEGVVGGLREECQGLRVQNQNLVLQNQNLQLQCKSLQTQLQSQKPLLFTLQTQTTSLQSHLKSLQSQHSALQSTHSRLSQQHTSLLKWQTRHRKRYEQITEQNKLLKKGQDMLNKSRELCSQMDSFYVEENDLMRQQYDLLKQENEKLTTVCEKFQAQAKEALRLRQEILGLREQLKDRSEFGGKERSEFGGKESSSNPEIVVIESLI